MSRLKTRARKLLIISGIIAFIGLAATAAWATTATVEGAPVSTVLPTFPRMPTTVATGTLVPSPAALPPGVPALRGAPPFDPKANFPGRPAITPSLPITAAGPALTEQDVRAYIARGAPLGTRIAATGTTVRRVLFATNAEVAKQLGGGVDTDDNRLICAVELAGSFTVTGPPRTKPVTRPTAYLFFDAKTGNLLSVNIP